MHRLLAQLAAARDPFATREQAILVPSRSAGEFLRRTFEDLLLDEAGPEVLVIPEIITREDFYARLHERASGAPPLLSEFGREVLLRRAAREAAAAGSSPPFRLRPGLIAEILSFYDELRRRDRSVDDFERLIGESLEASVGIDRGAERMMRQTRFLADSFRRFEALIESAGALDEHRLRGYLLEAQVHSPLRHLIVTVPDQTADHRGLWAADYDLLARLSALDRLDIVATESILASGFHRRIHDLLPGIEEERTASSSSPPILLAPEAEPPQPAAPWFTCRDREEELVDVARHIQSGRAEGSLAVVFQRPLPYLYLAKSVFPDAGLPHEAIDALPLAAEPFAAALDLLFTCLSSEGTRAALVELLGSPHWRFTDDSGRRLSHDDVMALDSLMRESKYLGGWDRLGALAAEPVRDASARRSRIRVQADPALAAASHVGAALRAIASGDRASLQFAAILRFVHEHEELPDPAASYYMSHLRARAAIAGALLSLEEAHRRHDDTPLAGGELAGTVRRWIENQTFSPRVGSEGVVLIDAATAAFAEVDEARLVGLVESDWPERAHRGIFYPAWLLNQLGWPNESDRLAAARARFEDLLRLPRKRISVSAFTLEDDAIVSPSSMLDELVSSGLVVERIPTGRTWGSLFHEMLSQAVVSPDVVFGEPAEWLALRLRRTAADDNRFRGFAGTHTPAAHAVSHVERYLDCPFKYFSAYVLRMDEERSEESGLTPQERGQFLHDVFERFFGEWHSRGRQAITAANLDEALATFEEIANEKLESLSEADRALERTYLLGSAVAAGLAERAFAFEIEQGMDVRERLLEHPLEGDFTFEGEQGLQRLRIRAKADRIDLLGDGTLRIIDYKLGRAPKPARALQLPIYGACASQHLEGRHGRSWAVSRAGYVAFREKNAFVPLGGSSSLQDALKDGERRFVGAVAAIERGEFPVRPDEPFLCTRCGYPSVCRKDYVGDE